MNSSTPSLQIQALDRLTGGAFSAATSGERAACVRQWLLSDPSLDQLHDVFKELSGRDKGAARLVRERLDDLRRARSQEAMAAEWSARAQALLDLPRIHIADALAWQRDAAKAGAPLSRDPLAGLKARLAERVKAIEDLQHRVQVQREAAVLLAQRIEVLSTKSWKEAQAAAGPLQTDVPAWHDQAQGLTADPGWVSVDARFPPLLDASRQQLQVVWEAFQTALRQAAAAENDPAAPLPPVPVWADELRAARGEPLEAAPAGAKPTRPPADPARRAQAEAAVRAAVDRLQKEMAEGHGKGSAGAALALRQVLKEQGRLVPVELDQAAQAALAAAGELEGWQRWRTDQLRQELVAQAEALFEPGPQPAEAATQPPPVQDASDAGTPGVQATAPMPGPTPVRKPRFGGRKMQEALRNLRDQWKQLDKGAAPNHALWKRFDEACNQAYTVVEAWLQKVKAESAEHRARRLDLIESLKAWSQAQAQAAPPDWKAQVRALHQFETRWREAGHLSEKAYAELQPLWKQAMQEAQAPLAEAQKHNLARRQALIAEAEALGSSPQLRVDAVRALQQRWQAEAHAVPLDRRQEQKLWDAFRKPLDEAFARKGQARDRAAADLSERDRAVLEASRAVEAANASGDAQRIRAALANLEAALRGQAQARADLAATPVAPVQPPVAVPGAAAAGPSASGDDAGAPPAPEAGTSPQAISPAPADASPAAEQPALQPQVRPRPVVAMRGDDRPGMKRTEPQSPGRGAAAGRPGDRSRGPDRGFDRGGKGRDRGFDAPREDRGPRLGDVAFRAQRDAMEQAQVTLRKLAAQAHGEALVQLLAAWEQRAGDQIPAHSAWGKRVSAAARSAWVQAVSAHPAGDSSETLLRLEIAAEVPSPADHLAARRMLQLQLLTRRNDPAPAETWPQDIARVLATAYDLGAARRLQNALKALMR